MGASTPLFRWLCVRAACPLVGMFVQPLPKITAPTAGSIVQQYQPSPAAAKLLQPNHTPAQYLGVLEQILKVGKSRQ